MPVAEVSRASGQGQTALKCHVFIDHLMHSRARRPGDDCHWEDSPTHSSQRRACGISRGEAAGPVSRQRKAALWARAFLWLPQEEQVWRGEQAQDG